ncbi:riboflavin synthase alpha chain [Haloactinospora alba]|uniref:Riboflavin synthase n=1 Tax=Haloactinospora alba TaxID=405555 RepID=A0A543NHT9_9ACTN|nr:riboflavin synthase [Haloactinospora alba]TQN31320.1 riboflavin synthase alpha chain [Haloactinospora alba]
MFTGIVEELGEVRSIAPVSDAPGENHRLELYGPTVVSDARPGDSIAVNGVCLTVTEASTDSFTVDVMQETLHSSGLGNLFPGAPVNLERAAAVSDRIGGHIVQGHVDGTGEILERRDDEHGETVRVSLPEELARYTVRKGSVTVDGVSLTIASLTETSFSVALIPTTLAWTTLGHKQVGDPVNLEVDVLAKYVERLLGDRSAAG